MCVITASRRSACGNTAGAVFLPRFEVDSSGKGIALPARPQPSSNRLHPTSPLFGSRVLAGSLEGGTFLPFIALLRQQQPIAFHVCAAGKCPASYKLLNLRPRAPHRSSNKKNISHLCMHHYEGKRACTSAGNGRHLYARPLRSRAPATLQSRYRGSGPVAIPEPVLE